MWDDLLCCAEATQSNFQWISYIIYAPVPSKIRIGTIIPFPTCVCSSTEFWAGFELMQGENSHDLFMLFNLLHFRCECSIFDLWMAMWAFRLFFFSISDISRGKNAFCCKLPFWTSMMMTSLDQSQGESNDDPSLTQFGFGSPQNWN